MMKFKSIKIKLFLLLNALLFIFIILNFTLFYYLAADIHAIKTTLLIFISAITSTTVSFLIFIYLIKYIDRYKILYKNQIKLKNELLDKKYKIKHLEVSFKERVNEVIKNLQKKEQLLQYKSKHAQINDVISVIAHQWRQPLSMISATIFSIRVKVKRKKFDLSTKDGQTEHIKYLEKNLDNIEDHIKFLSNTINDFRNFYEPEKLKEMTNVNESIVKALKIIEIPISDNSIEIETELTSKKEVNIFKNELTQVILNILNNAEETFIREHISGAKISIYTYDRDTDVVIEISDNGGGIDSDIIQNVFDPYFTTKEDKNGAGLGLFMSKVIIENHHSGTIKVQNRDQGALFTITFNI